MCTCCGARPGPARRLRAALASGARSRWRRPRRSRSPATDCFVTDGGTVDPTESIRDHPSRSESAGWSSVSRGCRAVRRRGRRRQRGGPQRGAAGPAGRRCVSHAGRARPSRRCLARLGAVPLCFAVAVVDGPGRTGLPSATSESSPAALPVRVSGRCLQPCPSRVYGRGTGRGGVGWGGLGSASAPPAGPRRAAADLSPPGPGVPAG